VAHRGLSATAPENTRAAFLRALDEGADAIELDVHLTRDDRVAVIHDRTLQRTTTGNGPVRSYSSAEIAMLDAGSWFGPEFSSERIPLLEDVLALSAGRCWINVELKSHFFAREVPEHYARRVVEVVKTSGMLDRVLFSSFDRSLVESLRAVEPAATTGVLYNWHWDLWRTPSAIAARSGASAFICSRTELTDRRLHDARAAGLSVAVYTVNDPEDALRQADRGVDVLISDAPHVILRALATR
jgi:glycerophosphoryl diester phosphodiesterase